MAFGKMLKQTFWGRRWDVEDRNQSLAPFLKLSSWEHENLYLLLRNMCISEKEEEERGKMGAQRTDSQKREPDINIVKYLHN